jgi:hypothetical protein
MLVFAGSPGQNLFCDRIQAQNVAEKMHNMFFAYQQRQVSLNDNAIKTVIYKSQQATKELVESFHRSSVIALALTTRSSCRGPMEIKSTSEERH